jgi:uncharacterized Zn-binding protein involved in type VI secretion
MPPAARITDMHVCPMVTVLVPHVGGPILPPCEPTVLIGFLPAARVTDMLTCVGPPDIIVMGSPTVLIGGLMAARIGDPTAHGGVIVLGCFTVMIGEAGIPAPSAPSTPSLPSVAGPAMPAASSASAAAGASKDDLKKEIESDLKKLREKQEATGPDEVGRQALKQKLLKAVETLDVNSPANKAVFYSGVPRDAVAANAGSRGLTTIETLPDGKWLNDLKLFDKNALGPDSAYQVWDRMSERYAEGASGEVHFIVDNPSPRSTFLRKELPALKRNPNVKLPKEWAGP